MNKNKIIILGAYGENDLINRLVGIIIEWLILYFNELDSNFTHLYTTTYIAILSPVETQYRE